MKIAPLWHWQRSTRVHNTVEIDWEEMRDLQLAFFKSGVPHIDTPQDHAFFEMMYQFAERYKVKYILTGANYSTERIRNPIGIQLLKNFAEI